MAAEPSPQPSPASGRGSERRFAIITPALTPALSRKREGSEHRFAIITPALTLSLALAAVFAPSAAYCFQYSYAHAVA